MEGVKVMELFGREFSLEQTIWLAEVYATPDEDLVHRAALEIIAALRESQHRADAAVADLEYACGSSGEFELRSICDICRRKQTDGTCPTQCEMNSLAASNKWEWRGPQEAEKG
jgi:hypothetical protein